MLCAPVRRFLVGVTVPIVLSLALGIDPGKNPWFLVATVASGVALIAVAAKLWRGPPRAERDSATGRDRAVSLGC